MFDCPRFFGPLARAIRALAAPVGGVRYIVLSHRDDVAGHAEWAAALGARRVVHRDEANASQGTDASEVQLDDADLPYALADGATLVHVPGHTRGSIALLHRPTLSLFTGDHLMYVAHEDALTGSTMYIWHSWAEQVRSVEKLADLPFLHGWPGHGRPFHFRDDGEKRLAIAAAAEYMRSQTVRDP